MKTISGIILIFLIAPAFVLSQGCLPEGITFSAQTQIDNFQANYPGCTEIEGYVTIEGAGINNLTGLDVLTSVGGTLTIKETGNLETLSGLGNLQSIGGNFSIGTNFLLLNLSGLNSLSAISGNFWIFENTGLTSLTGLNNLNSIGETISIYYNPALAGLSGISTLNTIGDAIYIDNNDNLTSLEGLENIDPGSILNLLIINNDLLSACDVESICEYLANPNGMIEIYGNASGCNSQQEVEEACDEITVEELIYSGNISIYPNPANCKITIRSQPTNKIEKVTIYSQIGEIVLQVCPDSDILDISMLRKGMYIVEVESIDSVIREKLIVQ